MHHGQESDSNAQPRPVQVQREERQSGNNTHSLIVNAGGFLTSRVLLSFLDRKHVYRKLHTLTENAVAFVCVCVRPFLCVTIEQKVQTNGKHKR